MAKRLDIQWMRPIALVALVLLAFPAVAQEKFSVQLTGIGPQPITLTADALKGLPVVEMDVTFQTSKGPSSGHYKGVLLWEILKANKAFEGAEHNAELRRTFEVKGRDDYSVAFSIGEIHPDFGNAAMILADQVDGKPFEDGYRIIVPGDKRGARNVREVVSIDFH